MKKELIRYINKGNKIAREVCVFLHIGNNGIQADDPGLLQPEPTDEKAWKFVTALDYGGDATLITPGMHPYDVPLRGLYTIATQEEYENGLQEKKEKKVAELQRIKDLAKDREKAQKDLRKALNDLGIDEQILINAGI